MRKQQIHTCEQRKLSHLGNQQTAACDGVLQRHSGQT